MGQQPAFHLLIGAEESSHRRQIEQYLQVQCGFGVTAVPTTDDLLSTLAEADGRFQLLLIPHALPGTNPNKPVVTLRRFLPFLHKQYPDLMIILLSDANFSAVQLRKIGIRQQLPACPALPALGLAVQDAAEYWQLKQLAMTNQQETAE